MAYGGYEDLAVRIASNRVLRDKVFSYYGYQREFALVINKFFRKNFSERENKKQGEVKSKINR